MKLQRSAIVGISLATAVLMVVIAAGMMLRPRRASSLPTLGMIPQFALLDQTARTVKSDEFLGHVMVANFIFLRCTTACPLLTARMSELRRTLDSADRPSADARPVRFASFSVDPDHDTPEKLAPYAAEWKANPATWSFLTGQTDDVQRVVSAGFKVGYTRVDKAGGAPPDIMHGNYFVVADHRGQIRGYYRTDTPEEMATLKDDILALNRELR